MSSVFNGRYRELGKAIGNDATLYPFCKQHFLYFIEETAALFCQLKINLGIFFWLACDYDWLQDVKTFGTEILHYYHKYNYYHEYTCSCKKQFSFRCELCRYFLLTIFDKFLGKYESTARAKVSRAFFRKIVKKIQFCDKECKRATFC